MRMLTLSFGDGEQDHDHGASRNGTIADTVSNCERDFTLLALEVTDVFARKRSGRQPLRQRDASRADLASDISPECLGRSWSLLPLVGFLVEPRRCDTCRPKPRSSRSLP